MFKAMVQALLEPEPSQEPVQSKVVVCDAELPSKPLDRPHMSLPEADPAGFYTDSAFFAKPPVRSSRNSCVRCSNAEAAVVCFSCSRFYGAGGGKFCRRCFQACHPFYRVKHKWSRLENMDQQAYRTSVERNIADIRGLLHIASNWGCELHTQDADTKGDDAIKEVARLGDALSIKIRDLKDLACEEEDRTKVEASAIRSMERNARIFQKRYEERAVSDAEAACGASW